MVASALVGLFLLAGPAHAAPAPAPSGDAAPRAKPTKVCTVSDERLREISGIVALANGYLVINDSTDDPGKKPVFFLNSGCRVSKTRDFPTSPLDPEDLALSPDGKTLWIADIGDNATSAERRPRVALWSMPVAGSAAPVIHRVSYPQGRPHDAEALLIADDGTPIIITKNLGKAEIYTPSAPLKKNNETPVPLQKVGEVSLPKTNTPNALAATGRLPVTGAARSPDGTRVVLRSYADAFEWDVSNGDIVKALTTGTPRVTPLADAFGEAITYTRDGRFFVTVSDVGSLPGDEPVVVQRYTPATTIATAAGTAADASSDQSWFSTLTLQDINYLIGAVGIIGAILVGAGIYGIVRARRKPPADDVDGEDGPKPVRGTASAAVRAPDRGEQSEPGWDEGGPERAGPGQRAGGVYGAGPDGGRPGGAVYGGAAPAAKPSGVYGGKPSGPVYGATGGPTPAPGRVYGGAPAPQPGGAPAAPQRGGVYGGGPGSEPVGGAPRGPQPGVYGGQPASRRPAPPSGGVYGGQPAGGGYGRVERPDEDYRAGRGGGVPGDRRRDDDEYDDNRAGVYGPPRGRRGGYPDNGDGYR
ncbi:hypothetical protein SAMN05444365_102446 [Micromonospora pattaloongensis]|uniref:WD40-like Beta Propeller Repeat n=2 Tax=Micromonospora pattaloongensis TaxID=405436 RepID=A0A1H3KDL4_9ACTN|nr:hypothetical protein SAMN05444365_102446 [Micromonospora pattaloongensis]